MNQDRLGIIDRIKKQKLKRVIATALVLWTGYFHQSQAQQIPPTPRSPETQPLGLEGYSFADTFSEDVVEFSKDDLQESAFILLQNVYTNISSDGLSSAEIPLEIKTILAQAIIQRISGHGVDITATSENVLRYFNFIDSNTNVRDNTINFDIRSLFNQENLTIQKFEDLSAGKRGLRILFNVDTNPLDEFVKNLKPEILNASLTFGTQQLIIYMEERLPTLEFSEVYVGDEDFFVTESSYDLKVDVDGVLKPYKDGKFLRLYAQTEVDSNNLNGNNWRNIDVPNMQLIEPYYSPVSDKDLRYPGALDIGYANREQIYNLARNNPDTIFVVAAGNYNSNSPINSDKPSNLIFVGMFYDQIVYTPGESDIYISYSTINATGLPRVNDEGRKDNTDSSSEATAVVSALITIYKNRNPGLSVEELISKFMEDFVPQVTNNMRYDRSSDGNPTPLLRKAPAGFLDIKKIVTEFSKL